MHDLSSWVPLKRPTSRILTLQIKHFLGLDFSGVKTWLLLKIRLMVDHLAMVVHHIYHILLLGVIPCLELLLRVLLLLLPIERVGASRILMTRDELCICILRSSLGHLWLVPVAWPLILGIVESLNLILVWPHHVNYNIN